MFKALSSPSPPSELVKTALWPLPFGVGWDDGMMGGGRNAAEKALLPFGWGGKAGGSGATLSLLDQTDSGAEGASSKA